MPKSVEAGSQRQAGQAGAPLPAVGRYAGTRELSHNALRLILAHHELHGPPHGIQAARG